MFADVWSLKLRQQAVFLGVDFCCNFVTKHQFQLALDTGDPDRWTKCSSVMVLKSSHDEAVVHSAGHLSICRTLLYIKRSGASTVMCEHLAHHVHPWTCPQKRTKKKGFTAACIRLACKFMPHVSSLLMETCIHWNCLLVNSSLSSSLGLCQLGQTCHHTYQMRHHPIKK